MVDEQTLLKECFSLLEHPFEPKTDPQTGLNFKQLGVSLARPLDIFRVEDLRKYFAQVGPFASAVTAVETFLGQTGYPAGAPPAFLIEGAKGFGRSTMASFLAYKIKAKNGGGASFYNVPVTSEHWGRLLFTIKNLIKQHVTTHHIQNCDAAFALFSNEDINPQDPSVNYLGQIFAQLAQCMVGPPPLVLAIESITWQRLDWITGLFDLLNPLNVVLIFLTDDRRVYNIFANLRNGPNLTGFELRLAPFDKQMATQFLTERLDIFRDANAPQGRTGLFPFRSQTMDLTLPDNKRLSIKLLEQVFRVAFNRKLRELTAVYDANSGPQGNQQALQDALLIPYGDLTTSYVSTLRTGSSGE
jgi:hypothetical protein